MRTVRATLGILLLPLVLGVASCRPNKAPVESPHSAMGAGYTADQVGSAVKAGVQAKRWNILEEAPGSMKAQVMAGGHSATVLITYDATGWTISYLDSSPGLVYEDHPKYGQIIHHRYNLWVRNLDSAIRSSLTSGATAPAETPSDPAPVAETEGETPAADTDGQGGDGGDGGDGWD